jgi:hypothetical protein
MPIDRKQVLIFLALTGLLWLVVALWLPRDRFVKLMVNFYHQKPFYLAVFLISEFIVFCDLAESFFYWF